MSGRISPILSLPVNIPVLSAPAENNPHILSYEKSLQTAVEDIRAKGKSNLTQQQ